MFDENNENSEVTSAGYEEETSEIEKDDAVADVSEMEMQPEEPVLPAEVSDQSEEFAQVAEAETVADETDMESANEEPEQLHNEGSVYASYHISDSTPQAVSYTEQNEKKSKNKKAKGHSFIIKAVAAGLAFGIAAFGSMRALSAIFPEKTTTASGTVNISKTESANVSPVSVATGNNTIYDVSAVVKEVMPAVVSISCSGTQIINSFFGQQEYPFSSAGTGIIVGSNETELLIATNNHVIANAKEIEITLDDESTATGYIKGTSSDVDLAVVAVKLEDLSEETQNSIKIATLGDSEGLIVGEPTIAIGNALGFGQSVTSGIISALDREVTVSTDETYGFGNSQTITSYLIQTDAVINPGNSGGPLLNIRGEVIGINSVKYSDDNVEGMGYAIPISKALPILEDLMSRETKTKVAEDQQSSLGISGTNVTSDAAMVYGMPSGVFVVQVIEGSGADKAGVKRGDIITKMDGTSISSMDDLTEELLYHAAGSTIEIVVNRNTDGEYQEITLKVTLGAKADISKD